jgi:hypothetical protein
MSPYSGTLLPAQPTTAIADTGCTGHFLQIDDHAHHRQPTTNGIIVQMPNHSRIQATHTCQINIPDLPSKACEAHLFPNLAHALLSIGLLCDHGCTAIFDKQHVKISYQNAIILKGYRDPDTNLWKVPLQPTAQPDPTWILPHTKHRANSAYHTSTQTDLITYLHAACGSPVPSTWMKAIRNGHFATWPGLTAKLVKDKLPKSIATVKGHLNRQQKNI